MSTTYPDILEKYVLSLSLRGSTHFTFYLRVSRLVRSVRALAALARGLQLPGWASMAGLKIRGELCSSLHQLLNLLGLIALFSSFFGFGVLELLAIKGL